jgi:glycosyltransferase involved in cell wall biosynthesis
MIRALRRAAREEIGRGVDLIHAHWWFPSGLAAPPGVPLVVTSHGSDAALLTRSPLARALAEPVYQRAAVVTAVSSELARWIETGVGRRLADGEIQPMPVEVDRFVPSTGGGGAVVVGRLVAQKRVHLAIEAMALLHARGVAIPLTVVGDGPERRTLEQLAQDRGLVSAVRFTGAFSPDRIPSVLATADLMLFPARGEGFGLVAAEAYLAGVPVVACRDGGGVLDIVPEAGAGRRVAPTAEALAAAVVDLLQSGSAAPDLPYRRALWRERLNAASVAAACERWYHAALASRPAA